MTENIFPVIKKSSTDHMKFSCAEFKIRNA